MNSTNSIILRLCENEIPNAKTVIAKAFLKDNLFEYFFPEKSSRNKHIELYFEYMLQYCFNFGHIYTINPDNIGISLWLPSKTVLENDPKKKEISGWDRLEEEFFEESIKKINEYNEYIDKLHKLSISSEHCYLDLIAVNPFFQGKGFATILLNQILYKLDQLKISCYLVTQNQKNVSIYEHFKFKVISCSNIPRTAIPHWEMIRIPD